MDTLHNAIIEVLTEAGKPLSVNEIHRRIASQDLWRRPKDSELPPASQISARINRYPQYFTLKNGLVSLRLEKQIKFLRLTWNENFWEIPSGHPWKPENQGKKNIPFENQFGFGHEEWIFNPRYRLDGHQYGYIRGVDLKSGSLRFLDKAYLYSVKKLASRNYPFYVGHIDNLEIIGHNSQESKRVKPVIDRYFKEMVAELKEVKADYTQLVTNGFTPIVKFKWSDAHIIDEPVSIPDFNLGKYKRFQPFDIVDSIEELFKGAVNLERTFFNPGKANQTSNYKRFGKAKSTEVLRLHSEIMDALEKYFHPQYSTARKNISIEKTRFSGNIADLVLLNNDGSISIYEIKTSSNARRNIREAIGQLLDYALHAGNLKVKKICIVSPDDLNGAKSTFLERLKKTTKFDLEYLAYLKNEEEKISNIMIHTTEFIPNEY